MYGWRGRVGTILPAVSTVLPNEFLKVAPDGVIMVYTRILIQRLTKEDIDGLEQQIEPTVKLLMPCKPQFVIQAASPLVWTKGPGYDKQIIDKVERAAGVPATTTATAVVKALHRFKARKVSVATPYPDWINEQIKKFLDAVGFEVVAIKGLGEDRPDETSRLAPNVPYALARQVYAEAPNIDCMFISCGNMRTFEIIEKLERDLGVPVVTNNQAAIFESFSALKIRDPIAGYGRLFEML
jgi:maleate isomerase